MLLKKKFTPAASLECKKINSHIVEVRWLLDEFLLNS